MMIGKMAVKGRPVESLIFSTDIASRSTQSCSLGIGMLTSFNGADPHPSHMVYLLTPQVDVNVITYLVDGLPQHGV
jgi:hypothetical protein